MTLLQSWKQYARQLKRETYALSIACRDPRVPWYAKAFGACVVGYAFSPIDLIPDFIPVLGYLDDMILVPLGIALTLRMIPAPVMDECRAKAEELIKAGKPVSRTAAAIIIAVWILTGTGVLIYAVRLWQRRH